jgi:predicted transcriptional regulator of viral defense system
MGKEKYLRKIQGLFEKSPVVSYSSIERIVKDKKNTEYTKQLVRNLILGGKVRRLTKGFYTLHDSPELGVFCFKPAYLGLQDSLSVHDLWEQETIPIIVTSRKIRQGTRQILGMNVQIRRIQKKYFFGYAYVQQGEIYFPYSDVEKTFIDMVYFKEKMRADTIENISTKINKERLERYLKHYPARIRDMALKLLN